jgi:hypothetical protein
MQREPPWSTAASTARAYSSALPPAAMNCVLISLTSARPPVALASSSSLRSAASGAARARSSRNFIFHSLVVMRYARTIFSTIKVTTATRDTSGTPALTASMIIEGRSDLGMADSVIPSPRLGKLTLEAIADRKLGNLGYD